MRIYATADIHGAQFRVNEMIEVIQSNHPDIIVICGDITQFGPGDVAYYLLNQLPGTVLVIPGNIDTHDVTEGIKKSHAINIHLKRYDTNGIVFLGINGVSDEQTISFYQNESNKKLFEHIDVLVSHVPPYGFQDTVFLGKHAGSKTITTIMEEIHPRLVLCGHIHENPGMMKNNDIVVVNCSMGKRGRGAIIELDKMDVAVEMV
jgi:uncharacterized protein